MGLHQIKKLLHIKGNNYLSDETTYRMGENLCKIFFRQRNNKNKEFHGNEEDKEKSVNWGISCGLMMNYSHIGTKMVALSAHLSKYSHKYSCVNLRWKVDIPDPHLSSWVTTRKILNFENQEGATQQVT
jgi:urease accessory protein UreF